MALVRCKECGGSVSSKAAACPHCGAKRKTTSFVTKLVAGLLAVAGVMTVAGMMTGEAEKSRQADAEAARVAALTPEQKEAERKAAEAAAAAKAAASEMFSAKNACKAQLEARLKDPKSADWPSTSSFPGKKLPNGTYDVQAQVQAKNSFNATVPEFLNCKLRKADSGWQIISVSR